MSAQVDQLIQMLDITAPETVEVVVSEDGRRLWVNIDGMCRLRVCRIPIDGTYAGPHIVDDRSIDND